MSTKDIQDHTSQHRAGDESDLQQLVADCIAWKRPAQRKMYEKYAPVLYNVVRRYIFNENTALELLNDIFYKIYTKLAQYSWQGPIEAWMRRIAVNTITDYLRKNIKHEKIAHVNLAEDDAMVDNSAVSDLSFRELVQLTQMLPDIHRAVFNLSVFEQLPHMEIGKLLDISEGNSRWILNDARKKLKKLIQNVK